MAMDKKGGLAIILEAGKPKGGKGLGPKSPKGLMADEEDDDMESEGSELSEAAALVRGALESGDDEDLAMALKGFMDLC